MSKLTEAQRAFLRDNPFVGVATTLRADGSPHATVIWVDEDGGDVVFNTVVGRAKERHLRRNPMVSVSVVDPQNAYKWVSVSGRATLDTAGADEHINKLAGKYLGEDIYPWHKDTDQRIIARISVDKVDATGFD
jgi:PPOX class probable F420-dependent enzyme